MTTSPLLQDVPASYAPPAVGSQQVAFYTFGCKTNLLESSALAKQFEALGWQVVPFEALADLYVFNTCTVTEKADAEARRIIRKAKRNNPHARIAVTGCYAQVAPATIAGIDGVDFIIGNNYKDDLPKLVQEHFFARQPDKAPLSWVDEFEKSRELDNVVASAAAIDRSRASLKIQDGCDYKCTYCIIWKGRGPSRSLAPEAIIAGIEELLEQGYYDISLTGINIGQYEWQELDLAGLLETLCQQLRDKHFLLRLTSLDPLEVTGKLISTVAKWPEKIAPHFHLSAQSANDTVLKAMARRHHTQAFIEVCNKIVEQIPEAVIGSDIIVGFPTETDADFDASFQVLADVPMHYMHVFRYSPRPGTPAAAMRPQVPERVRKERAARLSDLARRKQKLYLQQQLGKTLPLLIEQEALTEGEHAEKSHSRGLSHNYLKVYLPDASHLVPKQRVFATITEVLDDGLLGRLDSIITTVS